MQLNSGTFSGLGVFAQNKDTIWAEGLPLLRSTDGGITWDSSTTTPVYAGDGLGGLVGFSDLRFTDDSTAFLLPGGQLFNGIKVLRTTNSGQSWDSIPTGSQSLLQASFPTHDSGWIVGKSSITRTTDGGKTWNNQLLQFVANTLTFSDSKHGVILGNSIVIAHKPPAAALAVTTDGGVTWTTTFSGIPNDVWGVTAASPRRLFAVGTYGTIARSVTAGITWDTLKSGTTGFLFAVSFPDTLHGTAVGSGGLIVHTTDGGNTWTQQSSGVNVFLESVSFIDSLQGFAAGAGGTILKTLNGGLSWVNISPKITQEFQIQLYPLPANSTTTISYSLPKPQHIHLSLHQITGVKISDILTGEFQSAGPQRVAFDVSNLPSGTYILQLTGESVSASGKLEVVHQVP